MQLSTHTHTHLALPPPAPPPPTAFLALLGFAVSYIFPVAFHCVAYYGRARYQAQKAEAEADLAALAGSAMLATAGSFAPGDGSGKLPGAEFAGKDGSEWHSGQHTEPRLESSGAGGVVGVQVGAPAQAGLLPSPFDAVVQLAPDQPADDEGQLPGIPGGCQSVLRGALLLVCHC